MPKYTVIKKTWRHVETARTSRAFELEVPDRALAYIDKLAEELDARFPSASARGVGFRTIEVFASEEGVEKAVRDWFRDASATFLGVRISGRHPDRVTAYVGQGALGNVSFSSNGYHVQLTGKLLACAGEQPSWYTGIGPESVFVRIKNELPALPLPYDLYSWTLYGYMPAPIGKLKEKFGAMSIAEAAPHAETVFGLIKLNAQVG